MIILLNGAPRSGKDTAAKFIKKYGYREVKMSAPLKSAVPALFNLTGHDMVKLEDTKDEESHLLSGNSYRKIQIALSETLMKPLCGDTIFGDLMVRKINGLANKNIVISDIGFEDEVHPLIYAFGYKNLALVQIIRPGKTFENDSRTLLRSKGFLYHTVINNEYDLEMYEIQIRRMMQKFKLTEVTDAE